MRVLLIYLIAIVLAALSDGWMINDMKVIGHSAEAISILALLVLPFIHEYKGGWGWYLASYVFLRVGMFDMVHNLAAGLPILYHGTTSLWDFVAMKFNPPLWAEMFGRVLFLFTGIMIPIQNIKERQSLI